MASHGLSEDYAVTKRHGAVDGDLGMPSLLPSQDSFKRLRAIIVSPKHQSVTEQKQNHCRKLCVCVSVRGGCTDVVGAPK